MGPHMAVGSGIGKIRSRVRERRRQRGVRARELRYTRAHVVRQMVTLAVGAVLLGSIAAYQWSAGDRSWWLAIAFALTAVSGSILVVNVYLLLRHRHPVQVHRAVCNECLEVTVPQDMKAHQQAAGHQAAGWHIREDSPDQVG